MDAAGMCPGRAALRNDPVGHAGGYLQQDRQHEPADDAAGVERLRQRRLSPLEALLVQLQPRLQPLGFRRGHRRPWLGRPGGRLGRSQQRLLPGLHVAHVVRLQQRLRRPLLQLGGGRGGGGRGVPAGGGWPVGLHLQGAHDGGRRPVPAREHGAPVRVVVQVGLPLDAGGRRGDQRRGVVVVGRAQQPRLVAGSAEPRWGAPELSALGRPPGLAAFAAGHLQPRLQLAHALGLQLHGPRLLRRRRLAPALHQPAPAGPGWLQAGAALLFGLQRRRSSRRCQRHDLGRRSRRRRGELGTLCPPLLRPRHLRLPQLPGGGAAGPGRGEPAAQGAAQLPYPRLRQGVREDVAPEGAPALAHGRAALRVQLALLRQALHALGRAAAAPADSHGREALRLSGVQQALHAQRPPEQTH
uniref:transcription factor Sp9 isoform X3 n=1 Tax=Callithrix jacchus TaxID=9483 RepID=UPI00159D46C2|nr:transcription factor Sp9 isoform X3 [Callithrix jacchus]